MLVTASSPSSALSRARMTPRDRLISRDHCALVVSTINTPRSSLTDVARPRAGPTAARHANATLPSDNGAPRSRWASAAGTACERGFIHDAPVDPIIPIVRIILASGSPRRRELLRAAGFDFETVVADVVESIRAGESPQSYVRRLAAEKSATAMKDLGRVAEGRDRTADSSASPAIILGADTTVVVDGEILGKPVDDADAA